MHDTLGLSQPSVSTMQFVTTSRSPPTNVGEDFVAFALGRRAVDMLGPDTRPFELVLEVN